MATDSDTLGNYEDGKIYLVRGSTLNGMMALIRRGRPKAGVGITVSETSDGTTVDATGSTATTTTTSTS